MVKIDSNRPSARRSWGVSIETHWETQKPHSPPSSCPCNPDFVHQLREKVLLPAPRKNPEESKVRLYANNRNHLSFVTI